LVTVYLDKIFNPKSVAIIGASDEQGTVGYALMKNFTETGFEGKIYPVNIRKNEILGIKTYQTVEQIPEPIDLAVIATPAKTVPEIVDQCGKAGIKGIVIISAGFKEIGAEGKALEDKIMEIKRKYDLRIIGPLFGYYPTKHKIKCNFYKSNAKIRQDSIHQPKRRFRLSNSGLGNSREHWLQQLRLDRLNDRCGLRRPYRLFRN